jgi:hypothetical protein
MWKWNDHLTLNAMEIREDDVTNLTQKGYGLRVCILKLKYLNLQR